jgi:ribonuclease-3 family protein
LKQSQLEPRQFSPVALAFVGDGVFELLVRERLLQNGTLPAHVLHHKATRKVNAIAQAAHFDALSAVLNEEEQNILRRGRNAATSKVPKSCTPEEYRKATAIEALFGYLYLKGEIARISELFEIMDQN